MNNNTPKVIANWKMNGNKSMISLWLESLQKNLTIQKQSKCLFCPPICYLDFTQQEINKNKMKIILGAQNFDIDLSNSLTGGVSGSMLSDLHCKSIIIGHSERRLNFKEDDRILLEKVNSAKKYGLQIIYCVGETLEEKNKKSFRCTIKKQLSILEDVDLNNLFIAYEPVWAIGSGQYADPKYIEEVHRFIKDELKSIQKSEINYPVLYGGSVNLSNSLELSALKEVSGLLVGGASLDVNIFSEIVNQIAG